MQGFTDSGHEAWFADARRVIDVTEVTEGLPLPFISPDRAAFYFTGIPRADAARDARDAAERALSDAFGVTFDWREHRNGSTVHRLYEAVLPSGMVLSLVLRAEHADDPSVRELAAVA